MKKWTFFSLRLICLATGCLVLVTSASTALRAQQPAASTAPPATLVAVVDLPKIFEAHPTFKANMETLQQQLKAVDQDLEAKKKELSAQNQQLSDLNPSSAEFRRLEAELARKMADLQVQVNQTKKDFMQREALHYYTAHNEIVAAVYKVAEKYNIGLVLRFDSSKIDPNKPQSVVQGMSQTVVMQRNLDITQLVADELQLSIAQAPGRGRTK